MPLIVTPKALALRGELYHQLGMMTAAGLPIRGALEHQRNNPPSASLRQPLTQWIDALNEGATVGEGLRATGKWLPAFDIALVDAAEKSGRLDACFKLMASYYRERAQMLRQVISDLLYPLFLLHAAVLLLPFAAAFSSGNWLQYGLTVISILAPLYLLAFAGIYAMQGRHGVAWQSVVESALSKVPLLGTARRHLALARLTAALEALLSAGVPIMTAWELAGTASSSPALDRTVRSWRPTIENGGTYSEVVSQSPLFPELFANLYHTGEVSGTTDQTLSRLHTLYQAEGLAKMRAVAQWTPKIIYFGIVIVIAYKIISFYNGMYGRGSDLDNILNGK